MKRKAVIIGAGFAADMHIQALKALGIQVVGVAAGHRDSAKRFAEKNQIRLWQRRGLNISEDRRTIESYE
jgi:predicted dehydrogenase